MLIGHLICCPATEKQWEFAGYGSSPKKLVFFNEKLSINNFKAYIYIYVYASRSLLPIVKVQSRIEIAQNSRYYTRYRFTTNVKSNPYQPNLCNKTL